MIDFYFEVADDDELQSFEDVLVLYHHLDIAAVVVDEDNFGDVVQVALFVVVCREQDVVKSHTLLKIRMGTLFFVCAVVAKHV